MALAAVGLLLALLLGVTDPAAGDGFTTPPGAGASAASPAPGALAAPAQATPSTTVPCDDGTPGPSALPGADGPAPVGRCEPTGGQKAMDNLVWIFLALVLFGGLAGLAWLQGAAARRARAEGDAREAAGSRAVDGTAGGSEAAE